MRRREFIWLTGGMVACWPLAVRTQHLAVLPRLSQLLAVKRNRLNSEMVC